MGFHSISWGHPVSTDWVHWKELPVAIPATSTVSISPGSAVVDKKNSSGFGTPDNPPLVAIYAVYYRTAGIDPNDGSVIPLGTQAQDIAFSTDGGRLDAVRKEPGDQPEQRLLNCFHGFPQYKVFWYEPTQQWIMAVALSAQHKIRLYSSTDLKNSDQAERLRPGQRSGWRLGVPGPVRVAGGREVRPRGKRAIGGWRPMEEAR